MPGTPEIVKDKKEPQYQRHGKYRAEVCTAAWTDLRELLLALPTGKSSSSEMVQLAVAHQLQVWENEQTALKQADLSHGRPFGVDLDSLEPGRRFGEAPVNDVALLKSALEKAAGQDTKTEWTWDRLPYNVRCVGLAQCAEDGDRSRKRGRSEANEHFVKDTDEWILRNEMFLRTLSRAAKAGISSRPWTEGLLRLEHIPMVSTFVSAIRPNGSTDTVAFKLARSALPSLPGFVIMGDKRSPVIYLQSLEDAFRASWDARTDGLLSGLDWNNVFVAGGLVLGTLLTPSLPSGLPDVQEVNTANEWQSSDIDLYIYGLDVMSANAKIRHIAEVYKKNLPEDAPFLVVRNSQTITLYSAWPQRRVQIVLKLVKDPREVLLNFDLDVCAVGFDGTRPWILPRCMRALETGTNVFTMDIINGHYLGDRKATRDQRVFKYASKGYGVRILPSYMAALSTYATKEHLAPHTRGDRLYVDLSLDSRAGEARKWTKDVIKEYQNVGWRNSAFHWPRPYPKIKSDKPVVSHAMLESYAQVTSEPLGRSCLTSFTLLMRHAALWEEAVAGNVVLIDHLWATDTYGDCELQQVAYDDSPAYAWDSTFTIDGFKRSMDDFNEKEWKNIEHFTNYTGTKVNVADAKTVVARITYSESMDEILTSAKDIVIPVVMPKDFLDFASKTLNYALAGATASDSSISLTTAGEEPDEDCPKVLVFWRLNSILNWQMLDRRIDEIREALWSFYRAYERFGMLDPDSVYSILRTNLSRRAIRTNVQDEMESFVRWVGRVPYHEETKFNAHYQIEDGNLGGGDSAESSVETDDADEDDD